MRKKCVECGETIPAYLKYMCERCWEKTLKDKIVNDNTQQDT